MRKSVGSTNLIHFQVYREKMKEYIKNESRRQPNESVNSDSNQMPQILIDQLFQLQFEGKLDEQTVREELGTILISGNETSALTTSYIVLLLAMHPTLQERLFEELRSNYTLPNEETTYEHLLSLKYLDRVVKEGLRLFPVGPFLVRTVSANVTISNCTIPKNSYATLSIYNLHRVRIYLLIYSYTE